MPMGCLRAHDFVLSLLVLLSTLAAGSVAAGGIEEPGRASGGSAEFEVETAEEPLRADIRSAIRGWVDERTGTNEIFRFVNIQFELLWNTHPELRYAKRESSERIGRLWSGENDAGSSRVDGTLTPDAAVVLLWRTYHVLLADHYALNAESLAKKQSQYARLCSILEGLESRVAARKESLPEGTLEVLKPMTAKCILQLNDYGSSPDNPLLYYPLPDEQFEQALTNIECKVANSVSNFFQRCASDRTRLMKLEQSARPLLNFSFGTKAANKKRSVANSPVQSAWLVAGVVGCIVTEYGLGARRVNYDDTTMFPLWRVKGVGIGYPLRFTLNVDWRSVADGAPSGASKP